MPAGPHAKREAEKVRTRFLAQVDERRHPRTSTTVAQLMERYLSEAPIDVNTLSTYRGYTKNHILQFLVD